MAVSNVKPNYAFDELAKLGYLRPWEVSDANEAALELSEDELRRLMGRIADRTAAALEGPLGPSDADLVLATAANIAGIFAGVKNPREIAHAVRQDASAWTLVLSALDGWSYDAIAEALGSVGFSQGRGKASSSTEADVVLDKTTQIVKAYVSRNRVRTQELTRLIGSVHEVLESGHTSKKAGRARGRNKPAVPIGKSILPDYLICLEDGGKFKTLKRHLQSKYGMSPSDYRDKWGLPDDYPMVAPAYSAARAAVAKDNGFVRTSSKRAPLRKAVAK